MKISNQEYHASDGISRSAISELKKSPLNYYHKYIEKKSGNSKSTAQMLLGSMVHTLVLEPYLFEQEYVIYLSPGKEIKKKDHSSFKKKFIEENKEKQLVKEIQVNQASIIAEEILNHPRIPLFLNGAKVENSIYWIDEETQLLCKTRPDILNEKIKVLCDLKTTNDASPEAFTRSILKYDYHIQAAMQIDGVYQATGLEIKDFVFICAPTEKPHKPYIYTLDPRAIELGRQEYKTALKIIKSCTEKNSWDIDRDRVVDINFYDYQLTNNSLSHLAEIYL